MRLYHVTSPSSALSIVESGIYSCSTVSGDQGLNCFDSPTLRKTNEEQIFGGYGAMLTLECDPSVVIDEMPWRCYIPAGTDRQLIRIIDIRITEWAYIDDIGESWWTKFLPNKMRDKAIKRQVDQLENKIRERLNTETINLSIIC
ncbi:MULTISPECIES: hypothetical protein [unclassified Brenneria]|uniref:hypothetical protein n=1 Tax=unclassified Brenneria TaxID=2634434 RepID=UPI001555E0D4|nr:hypothetical protein [Brenneria sp. hezel4-2-4]MEE3649454.1 hypothetical protein [Brenneria sp. HEZEL_4_2_4]NPC99409.1 hypothetical protein [Brenneria sp. hezel4-2-4]